ncbi:hypothetical protein REPUB_Repub08aG0096700 [Reevesia pubescens]
MVLLLCRVQVNNLICIEKFSDFPQLGRFTLRTEGNRLKEKPLQWEKSLVFLQAVVLKTILFLEVRIQTLVISAMRSF